MGKLVNAKSLRLGYNPDINWGLIYPDSGWYGYKVLRDHRLSTYIRALVREIMEKRKYNFRQVGCWYSHCYLKRKGLSFELQIFFYEAGMDNFLQTGIVKVRKRRRTKRGWSKVSKVKFLMYEFMRRKIKLDVQRLVGRAVHVKFYAIPKKSLRASALGEYIVRRLYDGENVNGVFSDIKRMFDINFLNVVREESTVMPRSVARKVKFCQYKAELHWERRSKRLIDILQDTVPIEIRKRWNNINRAPLGKIEGVKVMGNGMFVRKHKSMSQHLGIVSGRVPLSTIMCNMDYINLDVMLKTSKCSIKVWLNRGESKETIYNSIN